MFTDVNRPRCLPGPGREFVSQKGNQAGFFGTSPYPQVLANREIRPDYFHLFLSSEGAKRFPKGKWRQFLYTGMTSNPALAGSPNVASWVKVRDGRAGDPAPDRRRR